MFFSLWTQIKGSQRDLQLRNQKDEFNWGAVRRLFGWLRWWWNPVRRIPKSLGFYSVKLEGFHKHYSKRAPSFPTKNILFKLTPPPKQKKQQKLKPLSGFRKVLLSSMFPHTPLTDVAFLEAHCFEHSSQATLPYDESRMKQLVGHHLNKMTTAWSPQV